MHKTIPRLFTGSIQGCLPNIYAIHPEMKYDRGACRCVTNNLTLRSRDSSFDIFPPKKLRRTRLLTQSGAS